MQRAEWTKGLLPGDVLHDCGSLKEVQTLAESVAQAWAMICSSMTTAMSQSRHKTRSSARLPLPAGARKLLRTHRVMSRNGKVGGGRKTCQQAMALMTSFSRTCVQRVCVAGDLARAQIRALPSLMCPTINTLTAPAASSGYQYAHDQDSYVFSSSHPSQSRWMSSLLSSSIPLTFMYGW